ncbi:MAG: ATP-binding cassette domain-containing protein [Propionicimonas sp.]|uniref:sulfate/molybdate ABC transporter ATP-binding protein n=1 Tax=Propionicimonas sp. TaxID=1955623 RepID=UPI002B1F91F2|nr:TOBE-like domain-containing protein [Propionicimonas sp.]MEA4945620.1 ATP-binding cassette domain-containing protein [Propionicimonas sp.]MEA5055032.1 ATP-binding cassette domain-containing protein [Propionicimonas sp.]
MADGMRLRATVTDRGFRVELALAAGERLAVLGPNGAGKSTLLGLLAGTVRPDTGRAELGGRVLFDTAARTWRPPHARGVALLAQDPLLFPHLSVLENVAFGPRVNGASRAEARQRAEHWLAEVDATELAGRRATELSGGQAQRVAIARALATEPELLLLDEPLAALDVSVAPAIRRLLARVLAGRTTLVVTHDLLDALLLSDSALVLADGAVVEEGPTEQVLQRPRTPFAARLAELNLVRGTAVADGIRVGADLLLQGMPAEPLAVGEPAVAAFTPSAVSVYLEAPHGSPRNLIPATVTEVEQRGGIVRVRAADHHGHQVAADVTPHAAAELDLYPGRAVVLSLKATAVALYPA